MKSLRFFASLGLLTCSHLAFAAAEPLLLDEIAIHRFSQNTSGQWLSTQGLLSVLGRFQPTATFPVPSSISPPPGALNRNLISMDSWLAYRRLGPRAVANFVVDESGFTYRIGQRDYLEIRPSAEPWLSHGKLVNLSSRGLVAPGRPMIGGFVIEDQHRWVLVRAVGPTLRGMGVAEPLSNPYLTLFRGNTGLLYNDDWSARSDAPEIAEASARVGAFPLPVGSKDAAFLVELAPGAYTAHVESAGGDTGDVLLEIYSVPERE